VTAQAATLELLGADVRQGRSFIADFEGPRGLCWLDVLGPKGIPPERCAWFTAPTPTLRLWVPPAPAEPTAVAVANRDFDAGLARIEQAARPHLFAHELPLLAALLATVRAAVASRRQRIPTVAETVTCTGTPALSAWASCLPLGDLEAALHRSARVGGATPGLGE